MSIKATYEFPHSNWSVTRIFDKVAKSLEKEHKFIIRENSSINYQSPEINRVPTSYFGPTFLNIKNIENENYIVISYWDAIHDILEQKNGWNPEKCKAIYTSSGVHKKARDLNRELKIPIIPISYCQITREYDHLALESKKINNRDNIGLIFRGWLHHFGNRVHLGKLLPDIVLDTKKELLSHTEYYKELQNYKINLSLNGAAEICHRDIEILSSRSVLFRPKLNQVFANPLIEGYHYIGFDIAPDPAEQVKLLMEKYNSIKEDEELLNFVSENGYNWFLENGTIDKNVEIILNQLDINLIL